MRSWRAALLKYSKPGYGWQMTNLTTLYRDKIAKGELHPDPAQEAVLPHFDRISEGLQMRGMAGDTQVTIAANASKAEARHLSCPLDQLAEILASAGITGCATLIVTWPKPATVSPPLPAAEIKANEFI